MTTDPGHAVPLRLQKFLARSGVASRRGSEDLMTAGRVTVNDVIVTELGTRVDPLCDVVRVDGRLVHLNDTPVYFMLNKPVGSVTTMSDPERRPTVAAYVPVTENPGLFPVGRLDYDTSGLLLFTTDGELAHRLLHPRWKVPKTYRAVVDGVPTHSELEQLRHGIQLDDGLTAPAVVSEVGWSEGATTIELTITEGRKRQVRRMCSAVGHPVLQLDRISFGPLMLGDLPRGSHRSLTQTEVAALLAATADRSADASEV